ncbi:MAG: hypothetical protein AAF346_22545 [Pseudomonadota bacterium]
MAEVETTAKFVETLLSVGPFMAGERPNPDRSMMHRHDVARLPETAEFGWSVLKPNDTARTFNTTHSLYNVAMRPEKRLAGALSWVT